jgi:hypothetical protein
MTACSGPMGSNSAFYSNALCERWRMDIILDVRLRRAACIGKAVLHTVR